MVFCLVIYSGIKTTKSLVYALRVAQHGVKTLCVKSAVLIEILPIDFVPRPCNNICAGDHKRDGESAHRELVRCSDTMRTRPAK